MTTVKKELTRMRTLVLVLIAIIIGAAAFFVYTNTKTTALPELASYTVSVVDVERVVEADGEVAGTQTRSVYYPSGSKVTQNNVRIGDKVNNGAVIAKVEQKGTFGTTTTEIKSPIRGRVTEVNYFVDDSVNNPSLAGIVIVDDEQLTIEAYINENEIAYVKKKQRAEIVFPGISLKDSYDAKVSKIAVAPSFAAGAVDYKVTLLLEQKPKGIKLGMSADVEILTEKVEDAVAIPESYLIERDDAYFVKKLIWENKEEGKYTISEAELEMGLITDEFAEVKSGIRVGEELIDPSFVAERTLGILSGNN
jgi:HlyD family secretion protein